MNDLNKTLLLAACVLFFSTLFFFFKFAAEKAYSQDLKAQKDAAYVDARRSIKQFENINDRAETAKKNAEQAQKEAQEYFTKAAFTRAELERLEASKAVEHQEAVALYKARLERETSARVSAEKELEKANSARESLERDMLYMAAELDSCKIESASKIKEASARKDKEIANLKAEIKKHLETEAENIKTIDELKKLNEKLSKELKNSKTD
ncbi:MAG: hypothetical protein J6R08_00570 [Opitutales bacterium]|nr:hypothetical protein [Opitutales bacterium]